MTKTRSILILALLSLSILLPAQKLTKLNDANLKLTQAGEANLESLYGRIFPTDTPLGFAKINCLDSKSNNLHCRYQVEFKHIPVKTLQVISHYYVRTDQTDFIIPAHLPFHHQHLSAKPKLSLTEALSIAKEKVPATHYNFIRPSDGATSQGLIFVPADYNFKKPKWTLAYEIDVHSDKPLLSKRVTINAATGAIIYVEDRLCSFHDGACSHTSGSGTVVPGTAETYYHGTQTVETTPQNGGFVLDDQTRGSGIRTFDINTGALFFDDDNYWNNDIVLDDVATDVHWGSAETYDFYSAQGLDGFDSQGIGVESVVHLDLANAYWDGFQTFYGDGDDFSGYDLPFTYIHIVGHEITHAVTQYHSGLAYFGEAGGLNEAISDIIGMSVQHAALPGTVDWTLGDEVSSIGQYFRNMSNPKEVFMADTYLGEYWLDVDDPHYNSSIANYWFYLLVTGGSGTNDNGYDYNVTSISWENAWELANTTWVYYLSAGSSYLDCALFSVDVATDMFGACSPEVDIVLEAWNAVGVLTGGANPNFFASTTILCELPGSVSFSTFGEMTNHAWDFGDGGTSSEANPTHEYVANGTYTVSLSAVGCDNQPFTITKTNLIVVDDASTACDTIYMVDNLVMESVNCSGTLVDDGGSGGYYSDNVTAELIVNAPNAQGYSVVFEEFISEWDYDYLFIYADYGSGFEIHSIYTGGYTGLELEIIAQRLQFIWSTDISVTEPGFVISWECLLPEIPVADFSSNNTITCDGYALLEDESTGFPNSWIWLVDNVPVSTEENPLLAFPSAGTYDIGLIACNDLGCDTLVMPDYITYDPALEFCDAIVMVDDLFMESFDCSGQLVDDGGVDGNYSDYVYAELIVNAPNATGYHVVIESFESESCCDYLYVYADYGFGFEIHSYYAGSYNGFEMDIVAQRLLFSWYTDGSIVEPGFVITWECFEDEFPPLLNPTHFVFDCSKLVQFDANSPNADEVSWNFGDGNTGTGMQVDHEYTATGSYIVSVEATNAFGTSNASFPVDINFQPVAFELPDEILVNTDITVTPSTHTPAQTFNVQWFLNGNFIFEGYSLTLNIDEADVHTLTCYLADNFGCVSSHTETILVALESGTIHPDIAAQLLIFPNPTNGMLHIHHLSKLDGAVKISLFNNVGISIWNHQPSQGADKVSIDMDAMPAGVFFLKIESEGNGDFYTRVVKI